MKYIKSSNDTIWNRTCYFPACSAVPQPLRGPLRLSEEHKHQRCTPYNTGLRLYGHSVHFSIIYQIHSPVCGDLNHTKSSKKRNRNNVNIFSRLRSHAGLEEVYYLRGLVDFLYYGTWSYWDAGFVVNHRYDCWLQEAMVLFLQLLIISGACLFNRHLCTVRWSIFTGLSVALRHNLVGTFPPAFSSVSHRVRYHIIGMNLIASRYLYNLSYLN
jgi:hypothetical protein